MNTSAIQGYQDLLADRITQLVRALEERQVEVELSSWLSYFSCVSENGRNTSFSLMIVSRNRFDFMGDLA